MIMWVYDRSLEEWTVMMRNSDEINMLANKFGRISYSFLYFLLSNTHVVYAY